MPVPIDFDELVNRVRNLEDNSIVDFSVPINAMNTRIEELEKKVAELSAKIQPAN